MIMHGIVKDTRCHRHMFWFNESTEIMKEAIMLQRKVNTLCELDEVKNVMTKGFEQIEELRYHISKNHCIKERIRERSRNVGEIIFCDRW